MDRQFFEGLLNDIENQQNGLDAIKNKIKNYMQTEMYRIEIKTRKAYIPCSRCLENGEIKGSCNKCGGRGTHAATKKYWGVASRMEKIENISDMREYGKVYWVSKSDFFQASKGLLYIHKTDAERECKRRNELEMYDI